MQQYSYHHLLDVLPTPTNPVETVGDTQWKIFEIITGINLPDDYRAYLSILGTGMIGYEITPYNPFCKRPLYRASYSCRDWMRQADAIQ
ncbi:MAG: hypothetical protein GFH27_549287n141 [Chloroflexi bacterium AL-W]|nr:hypothetical protein [Chloroflexi bacterium AL-N1]NOK66415.1 hypothetical protein [Chloroflexi bacterium AL-N10]NOK71803.1 hypothetical protein [Chloroflexi bacterium AL-N5]NOK81060.1 hypothetical protein [Chloroflexi bacterium AL-W]NOK89333.1 hypothetical protein [Chloroflexi bacterium AL-N15]